MKRSAPVAILLLLSACIGSLEPTARRDPLAGMDLTAVHKTHKNLTVTMFPTRKMLELDSYTLVNLYANLEVTDNLIVGAYVKNASDEDAVYDGIGTFQDPQAIIAARPRTIGATLRWQF